MYSIDQPPANLVFLNSPVQHYSNVCNCTKKKKKKKNKPAGTKAAGTKVGLSGIFGNPVHMK